MKFSGKPILFFIVLMLAATQVFAVDIISFDKLQGIADDFSEKMVKALPFNSTVGLNWSDAYIGNFPHFGIGLSVGATTIDIKAISDMLDELHLLTVNDLPPFLNNYFPLPAYSLETRIGVPVIPVDFGVKIGYLGQSWLEPMLNVGIKNMLIGADVRYAIIDSKVLPMRLSVGLGFNYLNGGISSTLSGKNFNFTGTSADTNGINLYINDPTVDVTWKTINIEFKTQVSFPYKIITPYAGAGISYAWSQAGYEVTGISVALSEDEKRKLKNIGIDVEDKNFKSIMKEKGINTRVFGGLSFNLAYVRLDLTGMYDIFNKNLGATLGIRFQM